MESTYLNFLPSELLSEILWYLDIDEIENVLEVSEFVQRVVDSRVFWINKLTFDDMEEYIQFLGTFDNGFEDYRGFMSVEEDVVNFMSGFKRYGGHMEFPISIEVDVKELINDYTLDEFKEAIQDFEGEIMIENFRGKYSYFFNKSGISDEIGVLTAKELGLLLIKLSLAGQNIFELSNLEKMMAEMYEDEY